MHNLKLNLVKFVSYINNSNYQYHDELFCDKIPTSYIDWYRNRLFWTTGMLAAHCVSSTATIVRV